MARTPARAPRNRSRLTVMISLALIGAGLVATAIAGFAAGMRAAVVETGSMGTTAPVGTLVITAPVGDDPIKVGDVVTFTPPTEQAKTYTHRVHDIHPDGTFTTKGDANGAIDPWNLTTHNVNGKAVAILPAVGYALRVIAITLGGVIILAGVTRLTRSARARRIIWLAGTGLVVAASIVIVHPIGWFELAASTAVPGHTDAYVISTSVLPETIALDKGTNAVVAYGQTGTLTTTQHIDNGALSIFSTLNLPWWGWVILGLVCAIPALIATAIAIRDLRRPRALETVEDAIGPTPAGSGTVAAPPLRRARLIDTNSTATV